MGSKEIWNLGISCGYVFIGVNGCEDANEKRADSNEGLVSVSRIFRYAV